MTEEHQYELAVKNYSIYFFKLVQSIILFPKPLSLESFIPLRS